MSATVTPPSAAELRATHARSAATADDCVRAARAHADDQDVTFVHPFDDEAVICGQATIADGIAIRRPGDMTLPLVERLVDDVATVDEDEIAAAMTLLLGRGKLVAEGAGAAATAALMSGAVRPAERGVAVAIVSGGNVDTDVLAGAIGRPAADTRHAPIYSDPYLTIWDPI